MKKGERQKVTMEEQSAGGYECPLFTHISIIREFTPAVAGAVKMQTKKITI